MSIQDDIIAAAQKYGIDPATALAIARIESNFNPNAYNKSGASGLFQFMPGTASDYGLSNPFDAAANIDAGMRLAKDNIAALTKKLGRAPTAGEVYLAHQQGLGGAGALLSNPNMSAVDALMKTGMSRAKAIASVQQNGGDVNMTAGQFAGLWTGKGDKYAQQYGSGALDAINSAAPTSGGVNALAYAPTPAALPSFRAPPIPAGLPAMDRSGPPTPRPITLPNGSVVIPGRPITGSDGSVTTFDELGNRTHIPPPLFNLNKEANANTILGGLIRNKVPEIASQVSQQVGNTVNNTLNQGRTLVADLGTGAGNLLSGLGGMFGGGSQSAPPAYNFANFYKSNVPATPVPPKPVPLPAPAPLKPPVMAPVSPLNAYLGGDLPYTPIAPPPVAMPAMAPAPLPPLRQVNVAPAPPVGQIKTPSIADIIGNALRSGGYTVTGNNKGFVSSGKGGFSPGALIPTTTMSGGVPNYLKGL